MPISTFDGFYVEDTIGGALRRPQSFVSKYEAGERRLNILELRQVCTVLDVTLVEFAKRLDGTR